MKIISDKISLATAKIFGWNSKSILIDVRRNLILVYFSCLLVCFPIIIVTTNSQVYKQASEQLNLLLDMRQAVRQFMANEVAPLLTDDDDAHPAALAPGLATQFVTEEFLQIQPNYYAQLASDNPLNPSNQPKEFEQLIIDRFRVDTNIKEIVETDEINDKKYLISARPTVSKASCLQCHGKPDEILNVIQRNYSLDTGLNYKVGEVVGASVFAVPLKNIRSIIITRTFITFGILALIFLVVFVIVNQLLKDLVLKPILQISKQAKNISQGDFKQNITTLRKDEIGDLFRSFELVRRSLASASKRIRKQKDKDS